MLSSEYTPSLSPPETSALDESGSGFLAADQVEFLEGLSSLPAVRPIDDFDRDDRFFLAGIAKRLRERDLEILMLPEASLRLSEMLRQGDRPLSQYVELVGKDPALSLEVLKTANAAFYAGAASTSNLQEAVMRVGLVRLQSILMVTVLKARVMKVGALQSKANLFLELALPVGFVASQLARARRKPADPCFMRGMLLHVEHLVMLGLVNAIGREHRTTLSVSTAAVLQAFARSGQEIRKTIAASWNLAPVLLPAGDDGDDTDYPALRHAVICRWLGHPLPLVEGVVPDLLEAVMKQVRLRVAPVCTDSVETVTAQDDLNRQTDQWLKDYLRNGAPR
jgi:HD-like signal output (HDOD) protein